MNTLNNHMIKTMLMSFCDYMCMYMCGIMDYLRVRLIM